MVPRLLLASVTILACFLQGPVAKSPDCSPLPTAHCQLPAVPEKLPDGVALWLDAARLKEAWQAHGKPPLRSGSAIDVWYDESGNGLDLVQRVQGAQPKYIEAGASAVVRFEGTHWLGQTGAKRKLDSCTLFVLAAPRSNPGGFRALFSVNETGKNDYVTGFNMDLGPAGTSDFSHLNIEGRGFGGVRNLLPGAHPFGEFRLLAMTCQPGPGGVQLFVDGQPAGKRDRAAGKLIMDQITVGARCYSNSAEPPFISGHFDGDIAEVILFERILSPAERTLVHDYLVKKHAGLKQALATSSKTQGHFVKTVPNPPAVQFLVPGFTVKELPVELPNINNVRYREDGKLVALGYNGNIYLLSGGKETGLEDKVELFWENKGSLRSPIGMALTPKGYAKGQGVFVAAKGKVVLIVDTDGDGKADKEIIVAQGWKELPHGVDALGLALDKDHNVYFGLGCADYTNAYLKAGDKSLYDLKSERGTIQKVSADFSKRETICTGIRFSVGLAFNKEGDLFATDQEGATWLPNGNPFDELLHIQPGRHYGFPPRHPKFLPNVVDEPSTFDYGPQHQSTCGLCFNDGVNGGPCFGPKEWLGDAIVCGESRGKLYRTRVVKSADFVLPGEKVGRSVGYVAQNQLLACLQMLTIDACVSPTGALVVACHSGPPDWGTGPQGKGKLYKIFYSDPNTPQPTLTWSSGPREVRIAFDKPLDPQMLKDIVKNVKIERGPFVRPGDRFETLSPPYAIVKQQRTTPRFEVPVHGVQIAADRRTLIVATGVLTEAGPYAITLPRPAVEKDKAIKQHDMIDLGFDLSGLQATWEGEDKAQTIWLPHVDLEVSRKFTAGSSEHEAFFEKLKKPAKLTFKTQLNLWNMLRPAIQPGSTLDYTELPEKIQLWVVTMSSSFSIDLVDAGKSSGIREGAYGRVHVVSPKERQWIAANISLQEDRFSRGGFKIYFQTHETREKDLHRLLPIAAHRFLLPWAKSMPAPEVSNQRDIPELKGGNWARGKDVFFSDNSQCSRCHQIGGKGGKIGPDLSNLIHRDYDSVLRDIRFPSAALNPDHLAYVISLKDGRVLTGTLRSEGEGEGDKLFVGTIEGKEIPIRAGDIESSTPSPFSVMPDGLDKRLSAEELRDLLTFLLTQQEPPFQPAPLERKGAPPLRKKAEVAAILNAARPVLVLADDPGQASELVNLLKLLKENGGYAPEVMRPQDAPPAGGLLRYHAVYLLGLANPGEPLWTALQHYVSKGGGVGVIPGGDDMNLDAYNRGPAQTILPGTWLKQVTQKDKPATWNLSREPIFAHPLLRPFKAWRSPDSKIDFIVRPRTATRYWEVLPRAKEMVLLNYDDDRDRPALLERQAENMHDSPGKVLMFTTTLDPRKPAWNNYLELTTSFYPVLIGLSTSYLAGDEATKGQPLKKLHIVLAAGPKDHGPGEHDYPLWQKRWQYILQKSPNVQVDTAFGWPSDKQWQNADVMVFYSHHAGWKADKARDLDAFLERGGGLVYLHWAVAGKDAPDILAGRIGLAAGKIKFRHGPLDLNLDGKHPIARGFGKLSLVDESYWEMTGDPGKIDVFGTGVEEGKAQPLLWTRTQGKGRVFVSIPGHYTWTFDDPLFRILVLRGIAWTAREPIDRLSDVAVIGARMAD